MKILFLIVFTYFAITPLSLALPWSINPSPLTAETLNLRKESWPDWTLPGPFEGSKMEENIFYPEWISGDWIVESFDLDQPGQKPFNYEVRFIKDDKKRVVGDRAFNAKSVGDSFLGDELLYVKDDPSSKNRQVAAFSDNRFLETTIIGRIQKNDNESTFQSDELALQIFLNSGVPRITQVETYSSYELCPNQNIENFKSHRSEICVEQLQALYEAPGDNLFARPIRKSSSRLVFHPKNLRRSF